MKKLLLFFLLLIGAESFSQATVDSFLFVRKNQLKDSSVDGKAVKVLIEPLASSIAPVVNSTSAAVTTLTETVKAQKTAIDSLKWLTLNQGIQISNLQQQLNAVDILVNSPTLTIGTEHNGKTIKISSQCVVTFPPGLNIKCSIIRTAKPIVTIAGSILTTQNYRSISGVPGKIDVDYTGGIALITGNLTR